MERMVSDRKGLGKKETEALADRTDTIIESPPREYRKLYRCSRRDLVYLFERTLYDGDLRLARWFNYVFGGPSLIG